MENSKKISNQNLFDTRIYLKTFIVSKEIIQFINKITNNNIKLDIHRLKNSLKSTAFEKLKAKEKKDGFSEAVPSKKNKNKKTFFHLGPNNNWKNILDKDLKSDLIIFLKKI